MFMNTQATNEQDGLHVRIAFGSDFCQPPHEIDLTIGQVVTGSVDGRPISPAAPSSTTFTFADGSPLPQWNLPRMPSPRRKP